jgi:REP element-mobilizing transposase RayT
MGSRERNPRIERVQFELRASGVKGDPPNPLGSGVHTRGYLPHVKREDARYFVTFRLYDSLPREVMLKYEAERAMRLQRFYLLHQAAEEARSVRAPKDSLEEIERDYRRNIERCLDRGCGECWLRRPEIADLVAGAIRFFEGERYELDAWVVMPNHVHAVLWPMPNHTLSAIVQSWKRFTSRESNKLLGRTGESFWQRESFDHWIRNEEEHERCCRYVLNNPVKAGLCAAPEDWKWSSAWRGSPS